MFTGIVRECGRLIAPPEPSGGGLTLHLGISRELAQRLEIGASLAVNGVCLTLVTLEADRCSVEVSPETLKKTSIGRASEGSVLNLEPALAAGDAMGGHWVQGHVDCVTEMIGQREVEGWTELSFAVPEAFRGQIVEKGSVTLDGVSLTVSALRDDGFDVALVPHTLEVTNLDRLEPGDVVNFEADILAKYVERALQVSGRLGGEVSS
ncbi:MAG: riboflavin synthase [Acidobacteriota bacterium]